MLTSPKNNRFRAMPRQRHIVPSATLFLIVTMMLVVTVTTGSQQSAGATEFEPKPILEGQWGCEGTTFHYHVMMHNQGNDWTTFTVSSRIGAGSTVVADHQVAGGDVEILDFVVPETQTATIHITDPDAPGIDDLKEFGPTDCCPDPTTTTTSTTAPPTTTSTTMKPTTTTTTTSTTSTTLPAVVKGTSTIAPTTSTTTSPVAVEAASLVRTPVTAAPAALAVTGTKSKPLGWIGFGFLSLGLALWMLSVRLRYAYQD
jgi:hypothetical protein